MNGRELVTRISNLQRMTGKTIITNPDARWEAGLPHHPRSEAMVNALQVIDRLFNYCGLDIETGGDGDNGETMMYLLDVLCEVEDLEAELKQSMQAI